MSDLEIIEDLDLRNSYSLGRKALRSVFDKDVRRFLEDNLRGPYLLPKDPKDRPSHLMGIDTAAIDKYGNIYFDPNFLELVRDRGAHGVAHAYVLLHEVFHSIYLDIELAQITDKITLPEKHPIRGVVHKVVHIAQDSRINLTINFLFSKIVMADIIGLATVSKDTISWLDFVLAGSYICSEKEDRVKFCSPDQTDKFLQLYAPKLVYKACLALKRDIGPIAGGFHIHLITKKSGYRTDSGPKISFKDITELQKSRVDFLIRALVSYFLSLDAGLIAQTISSLDGKLIGQSEIEGQNGKGCDPKGGDPRNYEVESDTFREKLRVRLEAEASRRAVRELRSGLKVQSYESLIREPGHYTEEPASTPVLSKLNRSNLYRVGRLPLYVEGFPVEGQGDLHSLCASFDAAYLDVSGSMGHSLMKLAREILRSYKSNVARFFQFSTHVYKLDIHSDSIWSTGGTALERVFDHSVNCQFNKILILTDLEHIRFESKNSFKRNTSLEVVFIIVGQRRISTERVTEAIKYILNVSTEDQRRIQVYRAEDVVING